MTHRQCIPARLDQYVNQDPGLYLRPGFYSRKYGNFIRKTPKRWSHRSIQDYYRQREGSSAGFLQLSSFQLRSARTLLQASYKAQSFGAETELLQPTSRESLESPPKPRRWSNYRQHLQEQIRQVEERDTIKLLQDSQVRHPTSYKLFSWSSFWNNITLFSVR